MSLQWAAPKDPEEFRQVAFEHIDEILLIYETLMIIEMAFPGAFRGMHVPPQRQHDGFLLLYRFSSSGVWDRFSRFIQAIVDKETFPHTESTMGGAAKSKWVQEITTQVHCQPLFRAVSEWYSALNTVAEAIVGHPGYMVFEQAQIWFEHNGVEHTKWPPTAPWERVE